MAELIVFACLAFAGLLAVPVLVLFLQVATARLPSSPAAPSRPKPRPEIAILVPAHNESSGIVSFCSGLRPHLAPADRLLVVADNCTDDTAELARSAGAEVVVRNDTARIGKGYALDYGISHLATNPPAVLIVIDADCELSQGTVENLAHASIDSNRPAQAVYIMRNHPDATLRMRIAEFAGIVRNLVRPLGYHRLGMPCMLMGTGMAFPWHVIARADLATGHIVEDMKLGVDLARGGMPPILCPDAEVVSMFPETGPGFDAQRTRWEHGHIGVILNEAPGLLASSVKKRDWPVLAMALDLAVPPLALLTLLVCLAAAASIGVAIWLDRFGPLWLSGAILVLLATAVVYSWSRFARHVISARELAFSPLYALHKLPLYLRYVYKKQLTWVRSQRSGS